MPKTREIPPEFRLVFEISGGVNENRARFVWLGTENQLLEVPIKGGKVEIQYDLMQVTAEQIADKLASIGADLGGGWIDRLKLAFINYLEETEMSSLEVQHKKGCHSPSSSCC